MSDVKDILNEQEPETGVVRISEDVIEVLTDKAAREIDGVAGLAGGFLAEIFLPFVPYLSLILFRVSYLIVGLEVLINAFSGLFRGD